MKYLHLTFILFGILPLGVSAQLQSVPQERVSLDKGWLFHLGDIPFPVIRGHNETYSTSKAGSATGAASPGFDDSEWRVLNLPHDWAVELPFDSTENLSQGYRTRGYGWYRRAFKLNVDDKGKNIEVQLDGVATNCTVWVNGILVHRNWCGYTSSYIDITQLAKYGNEINTIAVRVDANAYEGWWYEGAGIYRHTWLVKRAPVHMITDGVFANPIKTLKGTWAIPGEVTIENSGKTAETVEVEVTLYNKAGKSIASATSKLNVAPIKQAVAQVNLQVLNPVLWTIEHPTLYQVKTVIKQNNKIIGQTITNCGFRTLTFTSDSGFYLNGKSVKIKGVCNHQDHAGVGVAVPDALWEFRLRKLKEMGVNAYRCAHNPPSAEFLNACDSLGILVMDENRNFNTSPEYIRQLQWMVRRDRNHPSIILWSVFNEEPMQGTENGYEMVRYMSAKVKELDTTRPVTAAQNGGQFAAANVSQAVDVVGFNYQLNQYDRFHKENPKMKMTSSEDVSGLMTRGEYTTDRKANTVAAYDEEKPSWGTTHRTAWKTIAERPFIAGCFIWTGFDYRGEPTPYKWPSAGSFFGTMDLCGFPKTAFWIHQAQWRDDIPVLQLVPHWNWPQSMAGKNIKVMALSNADSVALWLNGKFISGQKVDKYEMNTWQVPYQPGKLEAIGYKKGKEISRFNAETTGEPASLKLTTDRLVLKNDGADAMPVTVEVLDAAGLPIPTANTAVEFEISGPGKIIGLGNGDPNSHEAEKGNTRKLFNGLAQVIIQSNEGGSEPIILTAKVKGIKTAVAQININKVDAIPYVAMVRPELNIEQWRVSPVFGARPDPDQKIQENDMNSWAPVKAGQLQVLTGGRFIIYRGTLKPYAAQQKAGGVIVFEKVSGKAEIWLAGKLIASKTDSGTADMVVNFPPVQEKATLNVLIEAEQGTQAGLGGIVKVKAD